MQGREVLFETPILPPGQIATLGTGAVVERPIVTRRTDGEAVIAIRSMVYLALTYDARLVDAVAAARFLATVRAGLTKDPHAVSVTASGRLTYSTLVHPGDTWKEMRDSLVTYAPEVKRRVSPDAAFGVSLRISGASAETLSADPAQRAWLKDFLAAEDLYVYTVNAFPYGPFKGQRVMENVYEPDWRTPERVRYTRQVADILADITEPAISPSIQSAPLAFRPNVSGPDDVESLTRNLLSVVAHLVEVERRTGRRVKLALEPEPFLLPGNDPGDRRVFRAHVYSHPGNTHPDPTDRAARVRGAFGRTTASGRGLRHLSPVGAVRGHRRLVGVAGRARRTHLQAPGRRRTVATAGQCRVGRRIRGVRGHHLSARPRNCAMAS